MSADEIVELKDRLDLLVGESKNGRFKELCSIVEQILNAMYMQAVSDGEPR